MNANDLIPPNNIEVEESILGGILLDPSAIGRVINLLTPECFYIQAHAIIYQAAAELYQTDKPTDLMSVTSYLTDRKLLKQVGGKNKLVQLLERNVSAVNIDHLASLVVDKHKRRELIAISQELTKLGYDTTIDLESMFDQCQAQIFNLTINKQDQFKPKTIRDSLAVVFAKISDEVSPAFPTGLSDLDKAIGGLVKQDLIVIAARASMGKTWLACYLTNHIAATQKLPVVFFSAEMSNEQLTKRLLSMHSGIDSHRLIHNEVYEEDLDRLAKALDTLSEVPIIIDDTPASSLTPARVRSVLHQIRHERGEIGLVVLDYIQKLGDRAAGNRAQAVGHYSGAFKDIAKEFNVPFVALAQINRGVESQSNKRPGMADIKDSGDVEQDADLCLVLYRDEYYHADSADSGVMEIIVAKNRTGQVGTCKVRFDPSTGIFSNLNVQAEVLL
jgi:replicative DNA helicase